MGAAFDPRGRDPENTVRIEAMARVLAAEERKWAHPDESWDALLDGEKAGYRRRAETLMQAAEDAAAGRRHRASRPGPAGHDH